MVRKVLMLMAIVLVFAASNLQAEQIPVSWDGGGDYNDWDDANNWDPNIVPDNNATNTYAITINAGTGEVHVGLRQRSTIDQLDCYGEVSLVMGPHDWQNEPVELILVDANGLTNYGDLEIGELDIQGNIKNMAGALLALENIELVGNLYNQADGEIDVSDLADIGAIYNDGRVAINATGIFCADEGEFRNSGRIEIYGGECQADDALDNNSTGIIKGFGVIWAEEGISNAGQIIAEGGSLAIGIEDSGLVNTGLLQNNPTSSLQIRPCIGFDLNNVGTIIAHSGGGIAADCNLVNEPNGVIQLLGGTLAARTITQSADANFAGFGSITGDVSIDPNGLIELTGPTNIVGDVNIPAGATLKISDGQTLITGHTTCDGSIDLIGGTVIFQGGCDCTDCNITHNPGTDRNHFDINADGIENFKDFGVFAKSWLWQATWY